VTQRANHPVSADFDHFVEVATISDLPPGQMRAFTILGRPVVLANIDGEFHAFADSCKHWGVRLSDGCLQGRVVRCRAHGWNHDIVKGEVIASDPPGEEGARMITFETRVVGATVWVSTERKRS
jgi:3-phenylpropionate/trans-cinnamate dioxygenase ferredoxin component